MLGNNGNLRLVFNWFANPVILRTLETVRGAKDGEALAIATQIDHFA